MARSADLNRRSGHPRPSPRAVRNQIITSLPHRLFKTDAHLILSQIEDPTHRFLVATARDQVIGFVQIARDQVIGFVQIAATDLCRYQSPRGKAWQGN